MRVARIRIVKETAKAVLVRPEDAPLWDGGGAENEDQWALWVPNKAITYPYSGDRSVDLADWFVRKPEVQRWMNAIGQTRMERVWKENKKPQRKAPEEAWEQTRQAIIKTQERRMQALIEKVRVLEMELAAAKALLGRRTYPLLETKESTAHPLPELVVNLG